MKVSFLQNKFRHGYDVLPQLVGVANRRTPNAVRQDTKVRIF